jgi:hypothetical protein
MFRILTYLLLFVFTASAFQAQKAPQRLSQKATSATKSSSVTAKSYPKYRNLGIGLGLTRSVVYLARNVKENNDATGIQISMVYGISRLLRLSMEYTHYLPIDIAPTWYNIKANTIEVNTHIIAHLSRSSAYFYPLFGLSYNTFSGTYTGQNDYLNLGSLYEENSNVTTNWIGLNLGTGYEYFFKPGSFFIDYKMRVGFTEGYNQINIQDVCIMAGLRFNIKVRSLQSIFIYRNTRSRYLLDKADED